MATSGDFRYHAAVFHVQVHTGGDYVAQQLIAILYHGGGRLVATGFNSYNFHCSQHSKTPVYFIFMNARKLVKSLIPKSLFGTIEPYGHLAEAILWNILNGFPARRLKVIGVTGTNGKTTTSYMIHHMLHEAGYKVGLMSTVGYGVGDDIQPQLHHMTNVSVPEMMQRLKYMRQRKIDWLVLETTSHALAQNRVWGVPYSVAVMTNITHEHLDYHKTFERYRDAKAKLFKLAGANKKGLQTGIVNADDASAEYFTRPVPHSLTYGIAGGELQASDVRSTPDGSDFTAKMGDRTLQLHVNVPGTFNVANALA